MSCSRSDKASYNPAGSINGFGDDASIFYISECSDSWSEAENINRCSTIKTYYDGVPSSSGIPKDSVTKDWGVPAALIDDMN